MALSTRASAMTDIAPRPAPRRWLRQLLRRPLAATGFAIIGLFLLIVALAPFLAPYSPTRENLRTRYLPPGEGVSWRGPDGQFGLWVSPVTRHPTQGITLDQGASTRLGCWYAASPGRGCLGCCGATCAFLASMARSASTSWAPMS